MSTSDVTNLPLELHGPLGQVVDPGGGPGSTVEHARSPGPGALAGSSPGLALGAAAPPLSPTLPSGDPAAMALLIAQLAGELFGGSSIVAAPLAPLSLGAAGASQAPSSPGVAPMLVPSAPAPSGAPSAAPTTPPSASPPSPFAAPSFEPMPRFGDASTTGPGFDLLRLPLVDAHADGPALDAAPNFVPAPDALGLESAPAVAPQPYAYQLEPAPAPLARDLGGAPFDAHALRRDFPILDERVHGKRLVWLDNAATTHKPRAVIDRISTFYERENSNVHRGAHTLAARATDAYEGARATVRRFINAGSASEIVFVRGATEGINLVAQSWGRRNVGAGDEIVITWLEHHANIVPWQQLCAEKGARLRVAPVDDRGDVILEAYEQLLGPRTRLVALPQVSNALGTITPAREMVAMAHRHGARVLVDGAQGISHMRVDVQQLDCDFYVFSGHKVFAPTGIGAVYGKREVLDAMPPWQGGGNMIQDVTFEQTTYQPPPQRFEAGTGNIADAAGLGAALDYLTRVGIDNVDRYEHELLVYATQRLATVPGLRMIGTSANKAGVLSFVLAGQKTEEVGGLLDKEGIAVRSGHHCAQPILRRFGLEATVRASLAFYNVCEDIDALVDALKRLQAHVR